MTEQNRYGDGTVFEGVRSKDSEIETLEPLAYIKDLEVSYILFLKQHKLANDWKSNLGLIKESGDVGLYLHPAPKKEPLNGDEILNAFEEKGFSPGYDRLPYFFEGVRFAEEHHGIRGGESHE